MTEDLATIFNTASSVFSIDDKYIELMPMWFRKLDWTYSQSRMRSESWFLNKSLSIKKKKKKNSQKFCSGASLVKSWPCKAGDTDLTLGPGRPHLPRSNWACVPKPLRPSRHRPGAPQREAQQREACATRGSSPHSPQPETAHTHAATKTQGTQTATEQIHKTTDKKGCLVLKRKKDKFCSGTGAC